MILLWKKYFDGLFWLTEQIPSPFPSFFFFSFHKKMFIAGSDIKDAKPIEK
jgi:hypothetical protein